MNVILAVVIDTWRQSLNQVVFTIMLVLFALIGISAFIIPSSYTDDQGNNRVATVFSEGSGPFLEGTWDMVYVNAKMLNEGAALDPFEEPPQEVQQKFQDAIDEAREAEVPLDRRAAEIIANFYASFVFTFGMWFFIGAASGYVPNMLEAGAIDIVLARPSSRAKIYLGKLLGGLALFGAASFAAYTLIFFGIGIRTGVWVTSLYMVLPLMLFTAAVLYGFLALLGVVSRSSVLCIIFGFVFYLVIDTAMSGIIQFSQQADLPDGHWVKQAGSLVYYVFPNFGLLKSNATASVVSIPVMDWQPFLVALAWLGITTALGLWRFQKADF